MPDRDELESEDPRRRMREMDRETREELARSEADQTGGVEHRGRADREGIPAEQRSAQADTAASPALDGEKHGQGPLPTPSSKDAAHD